MTARRSRLTQTARVRLVALMNGAVVGNVYQMGNGRLVFRYEDSWRMSESRYPLSLSMPLAATEHGDRVIRSFLWGLLPDNPAVLEWWARRYGVSQHRVVDLLAHVGEDCAGAVQLATPERAAQLAGQATVDDEKTSVRWLDDAALGHRLRDLRLNPASGRMANDTGQFSLAGAQPKTALYQSTNGRWGVPMGRMPTNRILKPPTLGLDDLALNEHYCLLLARELGLSAAASSVQHFGGEIAIVLERYDREPVADRLIRVHQEDLCQALGVLPTHQYESDGGPGIAQIIDVLRQSSTDPDEDVLRFLDAVALTWLLAATDGHAKNYSILHAPGPQLRLAPLYDVITALPYPQLSPDKSRLAMAIGGERLVTAIGSTHWEKLARQTGIGAESLVERVSALAGRIPEAVGILNKREHADDHTRTVVARIGARVASHARACRKRLR